MEAGWYYQRGSIFKSPLIISELSNVLDMERGREIIKESQSFMNTYFSVAFMPLK